MPELIIRRGPDSGTRAPLADQLVIGRSARLGPGLHDDFLSLSDAEISRRHVRIFREGERWFVEDLGSTNGTLMRGRFIRQGQILGLEDGDEIFFGNSQAVFRLRAGADSQVAEFDLAGGSGGEGVEVLSGHDFQPEVSMVVDASRLLRRLRGRDQEAAAVADEVLIKRMQAIVQVSVALGAITDRSELLRRIAELLFDIFAGAERAFVVGLDRRSRKLRTLVRRSRQGELSPREFALSRTIVRQVVEEGNALLLKDAQGDQRFAGQDSVMDLAIRSVMCAPLLHEDEVLGLIQVDTRQGPEAFSSEDLEILTGISAQVAIAMKNANLYEDIEGLFEGFVKASVQAIEARDPTTAGHSFRVADYTEQLAIAVDRADRPTLRDVRFDRDQIQEIRYAALLHDFGKVGVRERVLTKAKKLYPYELRELRLRFQYAKACLERKAYLDLLNVAEAREMSPEEFRRHREEVEAALRQEIAQLDRFLETIIEVNEPDYYYDKNTGRLQAIHDYRFLDREGEPMPLLGDYEFSVLSFAHGSLNPEERREIESHVSHTFEFLSLIPWTRPLSRIPEIAHAHHEKLDGTGYPLGLSADEIPVQSKIMAIADIFDALTAGDRPYREGISTVMALNILENEVNDGKLDGELFRVFVESEAYKSRLG